MNLTKFKYAFDNKRYHTWNYYLRNTFGEKVFKVSINAGFTCPNIDGKVALKGAYILKDSKNETPDVILMASGSEVELIMGAADELAQKGVDARVVSMPSFELFEAQSDEYKESVLPKAVRNRVAVEAASTFGWHKYVGLDGEVIGLDHFGASAPAGTLFKEFGFTVENVVETALKVVGK